MKYQKKIRFGKSQNRTGKTGGGICRKIMAVTLLSVLILATFSGCGSKTDGEIFAGMKTVDLEGNEVDKTVFQENELTMINAWATWCGPCVRELPELEKLQKELEAEDRSVGVLGLVMEVQGAVLSGLSEEERETAEMILEQTGATYRQLTVSEDMAKTALGSQSVFPTTYFVDKDGKLVGDPVTGSRDLEKWKKVIESKLEELQAKQAKENKE